MAKSSSSSDNKVYDDSYCSKSCRKNTKNLNTKISKLNEELNDYETDLYNYKRGLSQVEARLVEFKENEFKYCERIRVLERDVDIRDNKIEYLKNELEQVKKEKESSDKKLTGFENASKDLDNLLGSQKSDKNKEGLRYSVVPPPPAQIYSPPKKDLCWTGLPEFVDDIVTDYKSTGSIMSKPMIKFVKEADCPRVIKINNTKNARKSTVKYVEMYRNISKVNTARPKAMINAVRTNRVNDVKASACWVWKPIKPNSASITLKRYDYVDVRGRFRTLWPIKGVLSQRSDKNKEGLGYSVVPPPLAQIYSPPKKDLSWTGLPEFIDDTVTDYSRPTPSIDASNCNKSELQSSNFSVFEHEESTCSIMSKLMIKFVKEADCPRVIKINNTKNARKSTVKYAEMYRNISKGSQRSDKNNEGLGYSVVPPPPAQIYSPLKKDLSWTGLPEFVDDIVTDYSSIMSKPMIKFVKEADCPRVIKINNTENARKSTVKYAEMYRNISKVNTARPKAVINVVRTNRVNDVKASACWVCKSIKPNSASVTLKRYDYVDVRGRFSSVIAWVPRSINTVPDQVGLILEDSLIGFPAQSVRSSNAYALDSPYLLVLNTETSQSRQHGKSESDSYYLSD
uniref:Uncharacterized protein n=1 Tax=Tanacetum cinerariifolium TaxID=118510 RepID=A0A6L2ME51_TANCI|nr:hypothetical protein [Tanacetum cinerariifolium]